MWAYAHKTTYNNHMQAHTCVALHSKSTHVMLQSDVNKQGFKGKGSLHPRSMFLLPVLEYLNEPPAAF